MDIKHIARLANLPISPKQEDSLIKQFTETVEFVDQLKEVEVKDTPPTAQVTGATNVWREDEINTSRMFSQDQALREAPKTHNGFFVVPRIIE